MYLPIEVRENIKKNYILMWFYSTEKIYREIFCESRNQNGRQRALCPLIDGQEVPSGARQAGAAGLAGRQAIRSLHSLRSASRRIRLLT